jgi:hypothetical protein
MGRSYIIAVSSLGRLWRSSSWLIRRCTVFIAGLPCPVMRRAIKVYTRSKFGPEIPSWQTDLLNCRVQVFVSPGGGTVATMDQWGSIESDALVIYTAGGGPPKRYVKATGDLITDTESALFDITLAPSPTCLRSGLLRPMVAPSRRSCAAA